MNTLEAICSRKSIRSYTGQQISDDQLASILKAANAAPVGRGRYDTLHLTVVRNADLLASIDANAAEDPGDHPLYGAPLLIVVSSSTEGNVPSANVAMVIHTMALAAVELGIGQCVIYGAIRALLKSPKLIARLQLPAGYTPLGALALGVSEESYAKRDVPTHIRQNEV